MDQDTNLALRLAEKPSPVCTTLAVSLALTANLGADIGDNVWDASYSGTLSLEGEGNQIAMWEKGKVC